MKIICNQIKDKLKEKGITQDDFAKMMGVSSPTIKRWLKAEGLLFKDLTLMLEKLNVRLSEMAILSEASMINNFTYTKNQEEIFINTEGLLAFFDQLLKDKLPSQIAKNFQLTDKSLNFYLSKLDKMKLIEWLPNNKSKLLVNGEPSWILGGPLSQKFRKQIIENHIEHYINNRDQLKIAIYALSPESYKKINDKYQEILESLRILEIKDSQSIKSTKLTTIILGMGQNIIPILSTIPNK